MAPVPEFACVDLPDRIGPVWGSKAAMRRTDVPGMSGVRTVLLRPLAAVMFAVVVFGGAVAVTLQLKHVGEAGVRAQRDLQAVVSELHAQDALEWRVISGRLGADEVRAELA